MKIFLKHRLFISTICAIFLCSFSVPAQAETREIFDLQSIDEQNLVIGDVIKIISSTCFSSNKPTNKKSKTKIEIFENNRWRSVGKVTFRLGLNCQKKTPFELVQVWEVDRIGMEDPKYRNLGNLRLRNRAVSPTEYVEVTIFESQKAILEFQAKRKAEAELAFLCLVLENGQWDEQRGICIK